MITLSFCGGLSGHSCITPGRTVILVKERFRQPDADDSRAQQINPSFGLGFIQPRIAVFVAPYY